MSRGRNNRGWGLTRHFIKSQVSGALIGLPCYPDSASRALAVGLAAKGATDGQTFVPSYDYPIFQSALVHLLA